MNRNVIVDKPLISIIVPTFNSEKTLERCLKSVVNQVFLNWELLLMDGGSTDSTIQIAQSFNDERIKVFSEKDKGIYDAMNKGIGKASGDWMYFTGSDDWLYDDKVLQKVNDKIQENKADFIYGRVMLEGKAISSRITAFELLGRNMCHQAIFFHKKVFQLLGKYKLIYKVCADRELNLRCFASPDIKIKFINAIIANYSLDGYSSVAVDSNYLKNETLILKKYFSRCFLPNVIANRGYRKEEVKAIKQIEEGNVFVGVFKLIILSFKTLHFIHFAKDIVHFLKVRYRKH